MPGSRSSSTARPDRWPGVHYPGDFSTGTIAPLPLSGFEVLKRCCEWRRRFEREREQGDDRDVMDGCTAGTGRKDSQPRRWLMIAVLASAGAWADIQAVAGDRRCILARDQDEFLRLAGDADAVVLEAENLLPVLPIVRHINRDHPLLPVILITERDSADVRHLTSVSVEAVLFQHQIMAHLPVALRSSAGAIFGLRALAEDCKRNEAIPAPLRHLLTCALTSVPPPLTVQHLALLLYSDPATIRRHWRRGVNSHGIQRVKDLLDWIVLLHALSAKHPRPELAIRRHEDRDPREDAEAASRTLEGRYARCCGCRRSRTTVRALRGFPCRVILHEIVLKCAFLVLVTPGATQLALLMQCGNWQIRMDVLASTMSVSTRMFTVAPFRRDARPVFCKPLS